MNTINTGDTAGVLSSSVLVLMVTPALAFFYGGLIEGLDIGEHGNVAYPGFNQRKLAHYLGFKKDITEKEVRL